MGWFDRILPKGKEVEAVAKKTNEPEAYASGGSYRQLFTISYDGEKNTGELGPPVKYNLDYHGLRWRSWQSYLDNEITRTVIRKYVRWIIGGGLKLQSEPMESVLSDEGFSDFDTAKFTKSVEDRWKLWARSKRVDHKGNMNLNKIAWEAYINAIVGGDVLIILRLTKQGPTVQMVDGQHVRTPFIGNAIKEAENRGNYIKNGIECDKKGRHVAYWVYQKDMTFQRIMAKGAKSGREMAFLVYGMQYRIDDNRGIPVISTVLETLQKLDRYKEATVGSAEERAKIPYTIEHDQHSDGENPLLKNVATAYNADANQEIPIDANGKQMADKIAVTTQKQVFNLPVGSKLTSPKNDNDVNFKDFYQPNVESICAAIGIPPDVALSKYDSNFSASRAALKDWEHTIFVEREYFTTQFYQKIYDFWLDVNVLRGNINIVGYITALIDKNQMALDAFRMSRFVGANVPHIDPLKEVKAEREKLGPAGANMPLTTAEAATETINGGDFNSNLSKFEEESRKLEEAGISNQTEQNTNGGNNSTGEEDGDGS